MTEDYYTGSLASLKRFWEEKGKTKTFEREYSIRLEGIKKIINEIRTYVSGRLILDIGCGPGMAASLFPANSRIIGLDFSISMLRSAKNRVAHVVQGNAFSLPFRSRAFSVVTCLFVASDYSDKTDIFHEAQRVLRQNGFLVFSDYSLNDEHWKFRRAIRPLMGEKCNIFLEEEDLLANNARKVGLSVQEIKHVQFRAPFRLERYVKSEDEMQHLKIQDADLWKDVKHRMKTRVIDREFILIRATK